MTIILCGFKCFQSNENPLLCLHYMRMKKIFKIIPLFCAVVLQSGFISCKKSQDFNAAAEENFTLNVKKSTEWADCSTWLYSHKKVCIVFGYGYNENSFVKLAKSVLGSKFGMAEENGLIKCLVFPDDFKTGVRSKVTNLADILADVELEGLILLGAPENTHSAVSILRARYGGFLPFPVFSFFSQDDVLGAEWSSDFVLEKFSVQDIFNDEEQHSVIPENILPLLENAVSYMTFLDGPLTADLDLIVHVQRICGPSRKVSHFVDPDSGLRSANHFVFQELTK